MGERLSHKLAKTMPGSRSESESSFDERKPRTGGGEVSKLQAALDNNRRRAEERQREERRAEKKERRDLREKHQARERLKRNKDNGYGSSNSEGEISLLYGKYGDDDDHTGKSSSQVSERQKVNEWQEEGKETRIDIASGMEKKDGRTEVPERVIACFADAATKIRDIRDAVRRELFRAVKFIHKEDQLDIDGQAAKLVASVLGGSAKDPIFAKLWWEQRRNIKKALDSKRSTTSMTIKGVVIRKCIIVEELE